MTVNELRNIVNRLEKCYHKNTEILFENKQISYDLDYVRTHMIKINGEEFEVDKKVDQEYITFYLKESV